MKYLSELCEICLQAGKENGAWASQSEGLDQRIGVERGEDPWAFVEGPIGLDNLAGCDGGAGWGLRLRRAEQESGCGQGDPSIPGFGRWVDNDTIKVAEEMEVQERPEALCPWATSGPCPVNTQVLNDAGHHRGHMLH